MAARGESKFEEAAATKVGGAPTKKAGSWGL